MPLHAPLSLCLVALLAITACDRTGSNSAVPTPAKAADTTEITLFAHANIPEVERLIDDLCLQIIDQQSRLKSLYDALKLARREPTNDPEYRKWSDKVVRLEALLNEARNIRADAFIASKKQLLDTGNTTTAQDIATLYDQATATAAQHREEIATIIAGLPSTRPSTTLNPIPSTAISSIHTNTPPLTTITPPSTTNTPTTKTTAPSVTRPPPRIVILPLRNPTAAQVTVTEIVLAGTPENRLTIKAPFDQYSHGPRTSLTNWLTTLGAKPVNRAEIDALLVHPNPAAATRGIPDSAALELAKTLNAPYLLTGQFDSITAAKQVRAANDKTSRELFNITARFHLDLLRTSDGQRLATADLEFNDTVIEGQFRGFSDTTLAARLARGIATTIQSHPTFAQSLKAALE